MPWATRHSPSLQQVNHAFDAGDHVRKTVDPQWMHRTDAVREPSPSSVGSIGWVFNGHLPHRFRRAPRA